jgi:hypothetical protein
VNNRRKKAMTERKRNIIICTSVVISIALIILIIRVCNGYNDPQQENEETQVQQETLEVIEESKEDETESDINTEDVSDNDETDIETQTNEETIDVKVRINDQNSVYGSSINPLDFTVVEGDVDKQQLEKDIILTKQDGNQVGNYVISGECTNEKLNVTFENGTYMITPKKLTVNIDNKSSVYGEQLAELTYSVSDGQVVAGDDLGISLTKAQGTNVGEYPITGISKNGNYKITFNSGVYSITAREMIVKVDNKESYQGDNLLPLTYSIISGTCAQGDSLEGMIVLLTSANVQKDGEYSIIGQNLNANYNITFQIGVYKVKAKTSKQSDNTQVSAENETIISESYDVDTSNDQNQTYSYDTGNDGNQTNPSNTGDNGNQSNTGNNNNQSSTDDGRPKPKEPGDSSKDDTSNNTSNDDSNISSTDNRPSTKLPGEPNKEDTPNDTPDETVDIMDTQIMSSRPQVQQPSDVNEGTSTPPSSTDSAASSEGEDT